MAREIGMKKSAARQIAKYAYTEQEFYGQTYKVPYGQSVRDIAIANGDVDAMLNDIVSMVQKGMSTKREHDAHMKSLDGVRQRLEHEFAMATGDEKKRQQISERLTALKELIVPWDFHYDAMTEGTKLKVAIAEEVQRLESSETR